ncbi:MAG: hypothetical protein Q9164_000490 [Protoblastenia rupestris]
MTPQNVNTLAFDSNVQRGRTPIFSEGTVSSPFANLGNAQFPRAPLPPAFPSSQDGLYGPSTFTSLPHTQSTMSLFQAVTHSPIPGNGIVPHTRVNGFNSEKELISKAQAMKHADLEDGEVSNGGDCEAQDNIFNNNHSFGGVASHLSTFSSFEPKPDSHQLAHNLVREMHSWGLTFQDFVNEGMDATTLRRIYIESNLPIVTTATRERPPLAKSQIIQTSSDSTDTLEKEMTGLPSAAPQNHAEAPKPHTKDAGPKTSKSPEAATHGTVATAIAETKPMDRKALIAHKLAAKRAKPASTPKAVLEASTEDANLPIELDLASPNPITSTSTSVNRKPRALPVGIPKPLPDPSSDIEVKRNSQTELARHRIEALKQRVSVNKESQPLVGAESGRTGASQIRDSVYAASNTALPDIKTANASPPVQLLSRKASYFSPTSQNPTFNIPGLFSVAGTASGDKLYQATDLRTEETVSTLSSRSSGSRSSLLDRKPGPNAFSTPPQSPQITSEELHSQLPRLRQKASDFLDSPPSRGTRPLTQNDNGVIIDISDEEDAESDDDFDVTMVDGQDQVVGDSKKLPAGDLISLTDYPTQIVPRNSSTLLTSSSTLAPGKMQEPKELKTKEMEIELMNRKIAELEQRIKAKHAASRTQSPGLITQATVSRASIHRSSDETGNPIEAQNAAEAGKETCETSTTLLRLDLATEQELLVEKEPQERNVAPAEVEVADHVRYGDNPEKHSSPERASVIQTYTEKSGQFDYDQRSSDRIDQLKVQLRRGSESSAQNTSEGFLETAEVSVLKTVGPHPYRPVPEQQQLEVQPVRLEHEQDTIEKEPLNAQQKLRIAEIESGLPILNKEIERTTHKLQSLRQQEADLEAEVQKGINGRQMLLNELKRLSQATKAMQFHAEDDDHQQTTPVQPSYDPQGGVSTNTHASSGTIADQKPGYHRSPFELDTKMILPHDNVASVPSLLLETPRPSRSASQSRSLQLRENTHSDAGFGEGGMDISRSDLDEGEVTDNLEEHEANHDMEVINDHGILKPPARLSPHDQTENTSLGEIAIAASRLDTNNDDVRVDEGELAEEVFQSTALEDTSDFHDDEVYEPPSNISALAPDAALSSDVQIAVSTYNFSSIDQPGNGSRQRHGLSGTSVLNSGDESDTAPSDQMYHDSAGFDKTEEGLSQADEQVPPHSEAQDPAPPSDESEDDYEPPDTVAPNEISNNSIADRTSSEKPLTTADILDVREQATDSNSTD